MSSQNIFKIEGVCTSIGVVKKAQIQPFMDNIFQRAEGVIGYCSDDGSEQKIIIPEGYLRLWDIIHTQTNIWQSLVDVDESNFSYDGGRLMNAKAAFMVLSRDHQELQDFERIFRMTKELVSRSKAFAFFVENNLFGMLSALCERKLREDNARVEWEEILKFAQLLKSLGIIFKIGFMDIPLNTRILIFASTLVRFMRYDFKNKASRSIALYIISLSHAITYMRQHEFEPHTNLYVKFSFLFLEGLKYQMKKAKINGLGQIQRFYNILAQGAFIRNLDSPYGFFNRVVCVPSEPIIA